MQSDHRQSEPGRETPASVPPPAGASQPGTSSGQVSHWLTLLKGGDLSAAQPLWEQYFARLVRLVESRLPHPGVMDAEGVAVSAFRSFFASVSRGLFPRLDDRQDLWAILVTIAGRKVADQVERANALKRGGGMIRVEAEALELAVGREPSPEFAAMVAEEFTCLLDRLGDATLREIAVWKMEGYTSRQIGDRLGCSVRTVANKLDLIRKILAAEAAP
jgi:DNA-directed RNA polymerase specialized sigma24 family protein